MKNILIDAGPIIALFDKDDLYHQSIVNFLRQFKGYLYTTWPVITEVTHLLSFNTCVQVDFLKWLKRGAVIIIPIENTYFDRIIELFEKYSDIPMDLADSSLIIASEITGIKEIVTIDSDYYVYRTRSKKYLKNIFEKYMINEGDV